MSWELEKLRWLILAQAICLCLAVTTGALANDMASYPSVVKEWDNSAMPPVTAIPTVAATASPDALTLTSSTVTTHGIAAYLPGATRRRSLVKLRYLPEISDLALRRIECMCWPKMLPAQVSTGQPE